MIRGIAYDFDGVLTNNLALITKDGQEAVVVNRSDGMAIRLLGEEGFRQVIITTEKSGPAEARANKLELEIRLGSPDKAEDLRTWASMNKLELSEVAFVGNDINDLPALRACGFPIIVNDAFIQDQKPGEFFRLSRRGGQGAVRELLDYIIAPQGNLVSDRHEEFHSWALQRSSFHDQ